ncbi:MAG: hypoxanthine phosphoribosyltransferase [Chloroflexi bacterium]|nr:hypoxanthine phosphoribosyltransferase [Chloroflexota bacterium]
MTPYLDAETIDNAVRRLAGELDRDYAAHTPVFVGVLKGGFIFLADLVRRMQVSVLSVEFLRLSSYGGNKTSSGFPKIVVGLPDDAVENRHLVVVEDIVDTGLTTAATLRYLREKKPASIKLCVLLDKPERRRVPTLIDYVGFTVPDRFLVGYGLDLDQRYRQLPGIYILNQEPG